MPTTADRFESWLAEAKPGEQFIYAHNTPHMKAACTPDVARAAMAAQLSGHVNLVQARMTRPASKDASGTFNYIAIRTRLDTL